MNHFLITPKVNDEGQPSGLYAVTIYLSFEGSQPKSYGGMLTTAYAAEIRRGARQANADGSIELHFELETEKAQALRQQLTLQHFQPHLN